MDAIFLIMGGILIPLGFYLKIEQPEIDDYGTFTVVLGLICWLVAYIQVWRRDKRERLIRAAKEMQEQKDRAKLYRLIDEVHNELQIFNQRGTTDDTREQKSNNL